MEIEKVQKTPKFSILDKETVYDEESKSGTGDTDISTIEDEEKKVQTGTETENRPAQGSGTSDIFAGVETGEDQASKVSSVDGLPDGQAAMSFAGGVDLGEGTPKKQVTDAVELEIEDGPVQKDAADSSLDSFIKKLPK